MYLAIRPDTQISYSQKTLTLSNETRVLKIHNVTPSKLSFIKLLVDGVNLEEYKTLVDSDSYVAKLTQILKDYSMTYQRETPKIETENRTLGYWAAKGINPDKALRKIENSNILILGVGGIGSVVFQQLLSSGVRKLTIVDSDNVESSNLNRQFIYRNSDIGKPKVLTAKQYAHDFFGRDVSVIAIQEKIQDETNLEKIIEDNYTFDLAAICIDQPTGLVINMCQHFFTKRDIPCISGGVGLQRGFFGPVIQDTSFLRSSSYLNQRNTPYSFGPTNTIVASFMAQEIIEYLVGIEPRQDTYNINFENYTLVKAQING